MGRIDAAPIHPMSLAAALAPPPVPSARPMDAVRHWEALAGCLAPHLRRCRMLERPCSVLRIETTPVTPLDGLLSTELRLALVSACALRLRAAIRANDQLARVGDRGIAILLDGASMAGARVATARLVALCEQPYRIDRRLLHLCLRVEFEDH